MAALLYTFGIRLLDLAIFIASFFSHKASLLRNGRKESRRKLLQKENSSAFTLWIHCASLGEFEQGRPIIEAMKNQHPEVEIVLSFFSPSGYEIRKDYAHADFIFYLLSDTAANSRFMIEKIQPDLAIFVKYEFWHNLIAQLSEKSIPLLSVSTIFRPDQRFFKNQKNYFSASLRKFDRFFVQNEQSYSLLKQIGIEQAEIAGDTRFDRVVAMSQEAFESQVLEDFTSGKDVFVIGSSWPEDLEVLIPFIKNHLNQYKFIIAPHELKEKAYAEIEEAFKGDTLRFTHLNSGEVQRQENIMILDTMGQLAYVYRYARFAWVGGAYGQGLHSTLEPACYNIPVFFGNKNYIKFREATDLIDIRGAFSIGSTDELEEKFREIQSEDKYNETTEAIRRYVSQQEGATDTIMNYLNEKIASK